MKLWRAIGMGLLTAVLVVGGFTIVVRANGSTNDTSVDAAVEYVLEQQPVGMAEVSWRVLALSAYVTEGSGTHVEAARAELFESRQVLSASTDLPLTTQSLQLMALTSTVPHRGLDVQVDAFVQENKHVYNAIESLANSIAAQAGVGENIGDVTYTNDDMFVVLGLSGATSAFSMAGEPVPLEWNEVIKAGADALVAQQNDDGGWGFLTNGPSDADMTAAALQALYAARTSGALSGEALSVLAVRAGRANTFLTDLVDTESGGVELSKGLGSNAVTTAWVLQASSANSNAPSAGFAPQARSFIRSLQSDSGWIGWTAEYPSESSAVRVTSQSIPALLGVAWPMRPAAEQLFGVSIEPEPQPSAEPAEPVTEPEPTPEPVVEGVLGEQSGQISPASGAPIEQVKERSAPEPPVRSSPKTEFSESQAVRTATLPMLPTHEWRHALVQADGTIQWYDRRWSRTNRVATGFSQTHWNVFGGDAEGFGPLVALAQPGSAEIHTVLTTGFTHTVIKPFPEWTHGFWLRSWRLEDGFYGVLVIPRTVFAEYAAVIGPDGILNDYVRLDEIGVRADQQEFTAEDLVLFGQRVCDGWDHEDLRLHRLENQDEVLISSRHDNAVCIVNQQTGEWEWIYPFAGVQDALAVNGMAVAAAAISHGMQGWMIVSTSSMHDPMFVSTEGRVWRWK